MKLRNSHRDAMFQAQQERRPLGFQQVGQAAMHSLVSLADSLGKIERGSSDLFTAPANGFPSPVVGRSSLAKRMLKLIQETKAWRYKSAQWVFHPHIAAFLGQFNRMPFQGEVPGYMAAATFNAIFHELRSEFRSARFSGRLFKHFDYVNLRLTTSAQHLKSCAKASKAPRLIAFFLEGGDATGIVDQHRQTLVEQRQIWMDSLHAQYGPLLLGGAWKLELGEPERLYQVLVIDQTSEVELAQLRNIATGFRSGGANGIWVRDAGTPVIGEGNLHFRASSFDDEPFTQQLQRHLTFLVEVDSLVMVPAPSGVRSLHRF